MITLICATDLNRHNRYAAACRVSKSANGTTMSAVAYLCQGCASSISILLRLKYADASGDSDLLTPWLLLLLLGAFVELCPARPGSGCRESADAVLNDEMCPGLSGLGQRGALSLMMCALSAHRVRVLVDGVGM